MCDYELVKNSYIQDADLKLRFEYYGEEYHIEMGRFLLSIQNSREEEYFRTEVFSYYDCLTFNNGCLYFGDRQGMIHIISMKEKREILCLFTSDETEQFYKDHINMYPHTLPWIIHNHELGDYAYLPELHVMNEVASNLSISVLHSWGKYVIWGDLSGRVALLDTNIMKVVYTFKVDGAVSCISDDQEHIIVDYIMDNHFDSPQSLTRYENAKRIHKKPIITQLLTS